MRCNCGTLHGITEVRYSSRDQDEILCKLCSETIISWNSSLSYSLISWKKPGDEWKHIGSDWKTEVKCAPPPSWMNIYDVRTKITCDNLKFINNTIKT